MPADYEKVEIDGVVYYEYNNILYQKVNTANGKGYEVVGTIEWALSLFYLTLAPNILIVSYNKQK